jgi:hypothetical protein
MKSTEETADTVQCNVKGNGVNFPRRMSGKGQHTNSYYHKRIQSSNPATTIMAIKLPLMRGTMSTRNNDGKQYPEHKDHLNGY